MNVDKINKIVDLDDRRRELEAQLKEIKEERSKLEAEVLDQFAEAGIDNIKVGGRTVYLRKDTYCSPVDGDKERSAIYLKNNGLGMFVSESFNSLTVSAWVRERIAEDNLPDDFKDYFKVSDTFKIMTRK